MQEKSFIALIENSIKNNWNRDALTDYKGETLQYKDVARKIEKFHIVMQEAGIQRGDRIALCGKNCTSWCVSFLAIITYGAVCVPMQREFKADDVANITRHSGAKVLIIAPTLWEDMNLNELPDVIAAVSIDDFTALAARHDRNVETLERRNELFGKKYINKYLSDDVKYTPEESGETLAIINYTSGTTGFSKGVMLPYRSILSNVQYLLDKMPTEAGDNIISMLPLGHVFGMTCDFLAGFIRGNHIWFITRQPSPKVITSILAQIQPKLICSVPLVVEKIFKKMILPHADNQKAHIMLRLPIISEQIKRKALKEAKNCFGENLKSIIIGGAPLNSDIESFMRKIRFPYTIAYGLTETGPLISHASPEDIRPHSCGQPIYGIEVRIDNPGKDGIGELVCRGDNLMLGYYKNPEATSNVIDKDGWFHTGDMATIDANNFIYIKGRCKNMLLGPSGENIYPEEIESRMNNTAYVSETVVIKRGNRLIALVYPDASQIQPETTADEISKVVEQNIADVNKELPGYSQLAGFELWPEPFEKTAKNSIKRYLYTGNEK